MLCLKGRWKEISILWGELCWFNHLAAAQWGSGIWFGFIVFVVLSIRLGLGERMALSASVSYLSILSYRI